MIAKFAKAPYESKTEAQHLDGTSVSSITPQEPLCWKVYVDEAVNQRGSEVGLVMVSPEKLTIKKSLRLDFSATNNEVKYKVLLEGMSMVQRMREKAVKMFSNSRLVTGQVKGELEARNERMQRYLSRVKHLQ